MVTLYSDKIPYVIEETKVSKEAKKAVLYFARDLEVNFDRG